MNAAASPLKKIADLIRAGKADAARSQLVELLRAEPGNAQAWCLLSFVLDDPQRRQYALLQALKAQPDFERARDRLRVLRGEAPLPAPTPEPSPPAIAPAFAEPASLEDNLRSEQAEAPPKRTSSLRSVLIGLVLIALLAMLWLGRGLLGGGSPDPQLTATNVPFRTLPPVWTATPGTDSGAGATPEPGPLATLQPDAEALLQTIAGQVGDVRGFSPSPPLLAYLVREDAAATEIGRLVTVYADEEQRTERMLQALGLLPASASLGDYVLNQQLDAYGAAYNAEQRQAYLLGSQLTDALTYAYARSVVLDRLAPQAHQPCNLFTDACRAAKALWQGDANLTGEEWLAARGAAAFDPASLPAPNYARIQTQPPTDFAVLDLRFTAETGASFVRTLFAAGGWEQVDAAYNSLPSTTEQILHPEKYAAGEAALSVQAVDLATVLGDEWVMQGRGELGEWLTRLVLAAGADTATRIPEESAVSAATGWGGDTVQVYWRASDGAFAMAQHWLADDAAEGQELYAGVQQYLSLRFGGAPGELGRGRCWQADGQAACLLANDAEVVWLLLPDDAELIAAALALYPHIP